MKVLIVEDERTTRAIIARYVTAWGFEALSAEDGAVALALFQTNPDIQLVVTDWEMPNLNGPSLLTALHAVDGRPYTFTLLVSAHPRLADAHTTLAVRADDTLAKPFSGEVLRERLMNAKAVLAMAPEHLAERHRLKALRAR